MENKTTKNDTAKDVKEIITKEDNSKDEVFYEEKEKGKVLRIIWNVIFYSALAVFAFCAIFGIINFNKVKDGKEPSGYASTNTYVEEQKTVTVYNYYAYKIVKVIDGSSRRSTVSLKLWFLDDID